VTQLGEYALWIALPISIVGAVLAFWGGAKRRGDLVLASELSVYTVFFLLILTSIGIVVAFLTDRFDYWYVANYSNRELDTYFKVSGLWAGQRGSLVFWVLLLSLFSVVATYSNRFKNREFMPNVVGVLLSITGFFLVVLLFADVNPFERMPFAPADGRGLNPQLQNYWMTIHPPTLYLGFTAFTVPFAFAVSALLNGRLDTRWIVITRRWILLSWFFLANGIIFGMRWAYEELGWGGFWFWDPVENASLLPWLTATAFLHSIQIQENRGMLKIWNMGLVVATFLLTIFATFLTRSGLIESVHTFAENTKIAFIFLAFMGVVTVACIMLIVWRKPMLQSERQIESYLSRESAFLFNNVIFLAAAFAVMFGTLFPLITEGITGQTITVGPPYFNRINLPLGLALLALMGIGPVIAWRKASRRNLVKNFVTPTIVGIAVALCFYLLGARQIMALVTFGLSAFVMTVIVVEFIKGTKARSRIEGEGHLVAFFHLIGRNRRRWGGYIVHVGVVLVFTAFAGAAFDRELIQTLEPGESVTIESPLGHNYTLTYQGLSSARGNNLAAKTTALMAVSEDDKPIGTLTAEKRLYITWEAPVTEVGIRSRFLEDLYLILESVSDLNGAFMNDPEAQRATFEVQVNILVGWIWYGGFVITIGGVITMWPSRGSQKNSNKEKLRQSLAGQKA
jgi:cytochrome c-type biogenesis protein CcmF|tara:strand:- start:3652 stop:5694 length:2043 start_codon:yes stop_codon:yes gene_type:complete